ncbi:MAG: winged helix-turn-helix transcriptional regulator [Granulosicoccaceae bacterium]
MKTDSPLPGLPVRGSKTGKPIMALFDMLGRSWALGIIWQLAKGPMTFRVLQQQCDGVAPSVLNRRLKELKGCGFVQRGDTGYELSEAGRGLFELLEPLGAWSMAWAQELDNNKREASGAE